MSCAGLRTNLVNFFIWFYHVFPPRMSSVGFLINLFDIILCSILFFANLHFLNSDFFPPLSMTLLDLWPKAVTYQLRTSAIKHPSPTSHLSTPPQESEQISVLHLFNNSNERGPQGYYSQKLR